MASLNITVTENYTEVSAVSCVVTPVANLGVIQIAHATSAPASTFVGRPCADGDSQVCQLKVGEKVYAKSANGLTSIVVVVDELI